jgi:hypothetical protein
MLTLMWNRTTEQSVQTNPKQTPQYSSPEFSFDPVTLLRDQTSSTGRGSIHRVLCPLEFARQPQSSNIHLTIHNRKQAQRSLATQQKVKKHTQTTPMHHAYRTTFTLPSGNHRSHCIPQKCTWSFGNDIA